MARKDWTRKGRRGARGVAVVGASLAIATAAAACGGGSGDNSAASNGSGKTLRIAYQVIPNGAPIVKHQKWLEKNLKGVTIKWHQFAAAQDVLTALGAGSVDVGLIGSTGVATAVAKGLDFEVPWIYDVEGDNEALVVRKGSGVNSVKDLVGKTIATPFGSTTQYSLIAALKDAGVYGKVKVLDMKPPEALAAWNRKDIVGSYIWDPTLSQMKSHGGKVIVSSRQMSKKGVLTADLAVVSKSYAKSNPDIVEGWLKQQDRAVKLIKSNLPKAAKIVAKEFSISPKDAQGQMKGLVFLTGKQQLSSKYLGSGGKPGDLSKTLSKTCSFLKDQKLVSDCPGQSAFDESVNGTYLKNATK